MPDEKVSQADTAPLLRNGLAHVAPTASTLSGTTLAHFEVLELLGRGGFGEVYRARDTRLGRFVALKLLSAPVADGAQRERLRREAMAASALSHPGICTIHDLIEAEGRTLIVMELIEGHTVIEALSQGALSTERAITIALQLATALSAAHRAGLLHRDIKPGNVMLTPGGQAKLLDFGLAKRVVPSGDAPPHEAALTHEGTVVGTLLYMSPEQLAAQKVDERSDLFSLGVVLYEMVTGHRPFQGASWLATADAILHAPPPPIENPAVPERLARVVCRLLEKDPGRRFPNAGELLTELRCVEGDILQQARRRRSRSLWAVAATVAILAGVTGGWLRHRAAQSRWAREVAKPEIARLIGLEKPAEAALLAQAARAVLPGDATLEKAWQDSTLEVTIESVPAGAEVTYRALDGSLPAAWQRLGRTPLTKIRVPKAFYEWNIEKPGFRAVGKIWPTAWLLGSADMRVRLAEEAQAPVGMARVDVALADFRDAEGRIGLRMPGLQTLPTVELDDYWIDRHEVTNAEYARFVEAGGYSKTEWWTEPFLRDGRAWSWEQAMAVFRDSTGQPGPATWELGRFPKGQERHPVSGLSWYEAAAYARFVGKDLPTLHHWTVAAQTGASHLIVPESNFAGSATVPVGGPGALSGFGTTDMAGNAKEWCWNEAGGGKRYILGGGLGEPGYTFLEADAQSAWSRGRSYGVRCVSLSAPASAEALAPIATPVRDFFRERPASDEVFHAYKGLYTYDRTALDPKVEGIETTDEWTHETVSFNAAYGRERVIAHLYLPRNARPPYQTAVLFPGSGGMYTDKYSAAGGEHATFLPSTGRALLDPIYKGIYERRDGLKSDYPEPTAFYRDHVIAWAKDLGRSLDYLQTRPEIDSRRLAYVGTSWGAAVAPIMLAVEDRFRVAVLRVGGLPYQRALPEADAINFVTRVRVPTLMLNGRHDHFFPEGSSQRPLAQLLGTPAADKRYLLYETGHGVPLKDFIRESTKWLDHYLGPVQRLEHE